MALVSLVLTADELARKTLVQPFGSTLDGYEYHLVYLPEAAGSERITALRIWIEGQLRRDTHV